MAKESLKLVSSSSAPRSPAREALARAIAEATAARAALEEAHGAAIAATRKEIAAEEKLAALREKAGDAGSPDALIRALASGHGNAFDWASPQAEARAAIAASEKEIEVWQRSREVALAEIPARQEALEKAARRVDLAAREVVCAEVNVMRLIAELEEMQKAVVDRRLLFLHIDRLLPDGPDRAALAEFMARPWLKEERSGSWEFSEVAKARRAAFDALKANPDAELAK
jgi:hypothetical protein